MGVTCQILINKVKDVYRPGHAVTGRVKFYVDEQTEYKDVVLSFRGKGKCEWKRQSGKSSHTYRGTEEYITTLVNICNKKTTDETITLKGEYEYPFEFFLPKNIPRSYKDNHGSIIYKIKLTFVKLSLFSFNDVFSAEVPVYNYLKPDPIEGPIIFGLQKKLISLFAIKSPVVTLKATVETACVTPGDNVKLSYVVINDTDVEIKAVKTELYCYTTYTADCGATNIVSEKVNACEVEMPGIPENKVVSYSCVLPTRPELYSVTESKVILKEYRVRVTVRLPLPHINASTEFPILIGEHKYSLDPCFEIEEQDGAPPSYFEAMKEADKK